jgi:hypothetical protein
MVIVRFNRHFDIYTGGEVAGFSPQRAQELIALGVAEEFKPFATLAQLESEVRAAGYKGKVIKSIALDRFNGKHGEGARYLGRPGPAEPSGEPEPGESKEPSGEPEPGESKEPSGEPDPQS